VYIRWPAVRKREVGHIQCFLGGKTVGSRAPVSKVESKTFHRRKGTLQAFSRGLDIDELVLLVFGGWMVGMVTCYCWICQV
jgi:hypothetical protein